MSEITILFTTHRELGLCNKNELLHLIEKIAPDVIFEELTQSLYDKCYIEKTSRSLESDTILLYSEKYNVKHFPVGSLNLNEKELCQFHSKCNKVFKIISDNSNEYSSRKDQNEFLAYKYGFPYLNSKLSESINTEITKIELKVLRQIDDIILLSTYNKWLNMNKEREVAMIEKITDYCRIHKNITGLFLLGAGHRSSVKKIIETFSGSNNTIKWIITDYNLQEFLS